MARPKKRINKVARVSIACTIMEKRMIEIKAQRSGLSTSEFILKSALNKKIKESYTPEQWADIRKLGGMSNLLNQITRKVNSDSRVHFELINLIDDLSKIMTKILKA
jgi:hypothetical protein